MPSTFPDTEPYDLYPPKRSLQYNNLDDITKRALTDANERRATPLTLRL
jgi:hypothetical protein